MCGGLGLGAAAADHAGPNRGPVDCLSTPDGSAPIRGDGVWVSSASRPSAIRRHTAVEDASLADVRTNSVAGWPVPRVRRRSAVVGGGGLATAVNTIPDASVPGELACVFALSAVVVAGGGVHTLTSAEELVRPRTLARAADVFHAAEFRILALSVVARAPLCAGFTPAGCAGIGPSRGAGCGGPTGSGRAGAGPCRCTTGSTRPRFHTTASRRSGARVTHGTAGVRRKCRGRRSGCRGAFARRAVVGTSCGCQGDRNEEPKRGKNVRHGTERGWHVASTPESTRERRDVLGHLPQLEWIL